MGTLFSLQDLYNVMHANQLAHECSYTILLGTVSQRAIMVTTNEHGQKKIWPKTVKEIVKTSTMVTFERMPVEEGIYRQNIEDLENR